MKFFNTAGPTRSDIHYILPPLLRFDKDEVLTLIAQQKYFVLKEKIARASSPPRSSSGRRRT